MTPIERAAESKIGLGTRASGRLSFQGEASIEGEVEGEIIGEQIVIAKSGMVTAHVTAVQVTIAGTLVGDVTARERVELLASARVQGTIRTPKLMIREGAIFEGDCLMF